MAAKLAMSPGSGLGGAGRAPGAGGGPAGLGGAGASPKIEAKSGVPEGGAGLGGAGTAPGAGGGPEGLGGAPVLGSPKMAAKLSTSSLPRLAPVLSSTL